MADWRGRGDVNLALRLAGLLLGGFTFHLWELLVRQVHGHPAGVGARAVLLAALLFVSGSAGAALFFLGRHLFDEVRVSRRWARRLKPHSGAHAPN